MFSGIIENLGEIINVEHSIKNFNLDIRSSFKNELSIGESVAHNGVCLTISHLYDGSYRVNCVQETLNKTNLGRLKVGDKINLERSLKMNSRISGHFVQGHVDCLGTCCFINQVAGDMFFRFKYPKKYQKLIFEKGSISINGVSLTISGINDSKLTFEVSIIPHTLNKTTFQFLKIDDTVNLEFDMLSKQVNRNFNLLE